MHRENRDKIWSITSLERSAEQGLDWSGAERGSWPGVQSVSRCALCVLCGCMKNSVFEGERERKRGRKKTSVAEGGGQHSITRHPSSRAADEGATVCLSCQH